MDDYIEFNDDIAQYEQDDGFDNYIQTTIDPGDKLFIFTAIFCTVSIMALPFLVGFGNKRAARRKARRLDRDQSDRITTKITITNVEEVETASTVDGDDIHAAKEEGEADDNSNTEDLSIFSQIEKEYLIDNPLSQGDDSDIYCFGLETTNDVMSDILQTPFCCVGPDMKTAVEMPTISPERRKKRSHEGAFPAAETTSRGFYLKRSVSNSSRDSLGKKKMTRR